MALRLPEIWLERAEALREHITHGQAGMHLTRSDLVRIIFARGLEVIEGEAKKPRRS